MSNYLEDKDLAFLKNCPNEDLKALADLLVKGVLNMTKMIPVVGAVFGAGFDIFTTKTIGATAKKIFIDGKVG